MEIEDKVHIKLSKADIEMILKKHFKQEGIDVKQIKFNVRTIPDDGSVFSSYQLSDATGEGVRCEKPSSGRGGMVYG